MRAKAVAFFAALPGNGARAAPASAANAERLVVFANMRFHPYLTHVEQNHGVVLRRERVLDGGPHFLMHVRSHPLLPHLFALKRQREPVIDSGRGFAHKRRTHLQHFDIDVSRLFGGRGPKDRLKILQHLLFFRGIHRDRKSTRLNSSHRCISYPVFCLKKKRDAPPRKKRPNRHPRPTHRPLSAGAPTSIGGQRGAVDPLPTAPMTGAIAQRFFLMVRRPPRSTLFPYAALFRS